MPLRTALWLFFAGLLASSVNAAAGGGTLLSFPSLMAAGLSPIAANATSTVGLLSGYLASVAGYRSDMRRLRGEVIFIVALYAGYFGAGAGILFLAAMGLMYGRDLGQVNAIKVFVSLLANVIAAITFMVLEVLHPTGTLSFRAVVPLAIGAVSGGYLGVRVARRLPPKGLRTFAATIGLGIAVYFLFFRRR